MIVRESYLGSRRWKRQFRDGRSLRYQPWTLAARWLSERAATATWFSVVEATALRRLVQLVHMLYSNQQHQPHPTQTWDTCLCILTRSPGDSMHLQVWGELFWHNNKGYSIVSVFDDKQGCSEYGGQCTLLDHTFSRSYPRQGLLTHGREIKVFDGGLLGCFWFLLLFL